MAVQCTFKTVQSTTEYWADISWPSTSGVALASEAFFCPDAATS
jgi:hypothetical protein